MLQNEQCSELHYIAMLFSFFKQRFVRKSFYGLHKKETRTQVQKRKLPFMFLYNIWLYYLLVDL